MSLMVPRLADSPRAAQTLARAAVCYSDLDGTLLGRGGSLLTDHEGNPTERTAGAVVAVNRAGFPVVAISGRNAGQLTEITRLLGWTGYLAELGAVAVRERAGRIEYNLGLWPADALEGDDTPYGKIEQLGVPMALMEAYPGLIEYHDPYHTGRLATHIMRGGIDVVAAQAVVDAATGPDLPVDIVDNGIIHPWRTTLVGVETVHIYHLVPRGVDKRTAVERDLAARGFKREDAVAIGDSSADLAMAHAVGLMVLVGNALDHPETVEKALTCENVVFTDERQGAGWAEFADAWLEARGR
jgi:hydroxymethylpyrimidine pyrophosphatase-like HAD family hydrolase